MTHQRRSFLAIIGLATLGTFFKNVPNALSKAIQSCLPTTRDVMGPFYKPMSPSRMVIASMEEAGQRLLISGTVYGADCLTPLSNALVEVWQANAAGVYDNSAKYNLRGQVLTAADGAYTFETVFPGSYDNRPSHIHYRVSANGYTTLVTQLYYEGDKLIPKDPFASIPSAAERIKPLDKTTNTWKTNFDINLASVMSTDELEEKQGYFALAGENPFSDSTKLSFANYQMADINISIANQQGIVVRTLLKEKQATPNRQTISWNGADQQGNPLPAGIYMATLQQNQITIGNIKLVKK